MTEIGENKETQNENSAIGLPKSVNPNPLALLPFKWKIGLLFALFELFLWKKGRSPRLKGRNQNETRPMLPTRLLTFRLCKRFGSTICRSWAFWCKRSFFKISNHFVKFGCFSRYHTLFFKKNEFDFLVQNLILHRLAPNSNFKTLKQKSSCDNLFLLCFDFWWF